MEEHQFSYKIYFSESELSKSVSAKWPVSFKIRILHSTSGVQVVKMLLTYTIDFKPIAILFKFFYRLFTTCKRFFREVRKSSE